MIVDIHTHFPGRPINGAEERYFNELLKVRPGARSVMDDYIYASKPENYWIAMRPVDKAVCFGNGVFVPHVRASTDENKAIAKYVSEYPEKLIGFCHINLDDDNAVEEIRRCVEDYRFKGVGEILAPSTGHPGVLRSWRGEGRETTPRERCFLNNRKYFPIYEVIQELDVPILIHMGSEPRSNLLDVLSNFPELRIIVAHVGGFQVAETVSIMEEKRNLYADISGLSTSPFRLYNCLINAMEHHVINKLLFGTDWPYLGTTAAQYIGILRSMCQPEMEEMNLRRVPNEYMENILGNNAKKLLKL